LGTNHIELYFNIPELNVDLLLKTHLSIRTLLGDIVKRLTNLKTGKYWVFNSLIKVCLSVDLIGCCVVFNLTFFIDLKACLGVIHFTLIKNDCHGGRPTRGEEINVG